MAVLASYACSFRAPLHIGERGVGLEETRTYVSADTLFSALCSMWRELYGVEALREDVLDWFTEGEAGSEPFFLSSAFPCAKNLRFFPKPLARLNVEIDAGEDKVFKRVRFVSASIFTDLVHGQKLMFSEADCINSHTVWVTNKEKTELADLTDDTVSDIVLWKRDVVPRVTLDRLTSGSEIWHIGDIKFNAEVGLWFSAVFNEEHGETLRRKFEACLRVLGDTGLGGERSAGHGLFTWNQPDEATLPAPDNADADCFVTLAPLCPKDAGQLTALTGAAASYELLPRRGWVTSPEGSNLRRKMVWMFAEGSVLTGNPSSRAGGLVNVTPEVCPHDVWRYGYAFPVGMKTS